MDKVWKVVRVSDDGAIRLDLDYFSYHHTPERAFSSRFLTLFGQPHNDGAPVESEYYADVAASLQHVTEEIPLRMARAACARSGLKKLVMAGGVALNAVANGRIQDEAGIEQLYVQPSAGDGGGALGPPSGHGTWCLAGLEDFKCVMRRGDGPCPWMRPGRNWRAPASLPCA